MILVNKLKKKQNISLVVIYLLLLAFTPANGYNSSVQVILFNDYTDISVSDAYYMTQNINGLFILDVRTTEEYSVGHIENSYLLQYIDIESRQDELPDNKSQPILVYCRSGRRSAIASDILVDLNFTSVYNMLDGFLAWLDANYDYQTSNLDPTQDLTDVIIVITMISTLGFVIILSTGILISKKNQKDRD